MRKNLASVICLLMLAAMVSACGKNADVNTPFTQDNNIYTYEKIDSGKTQLIVSVTGSVYIGDLCEAFEAKNPDIQVIQIDITGGDNITVPVRDWLNHGYVPDVMVWAGSPYNLINPKDYFVDISAMDYVDAYESESLNRAAIDGHIYLLPGPSQIGSISYNKGLFKEYGWKLPTTFDEFIEVCKQITEDTNGEIQPWNPNAKYSSELISAIEGFTFSEILKGVDNVSWYNDFLNGRSTYSEHMRPFYTAWEKLIDAGLVNKDHFAYSATTRLKEFNEGKIVFINKVASSPVSNDIDIGYLPFPGKTADDSFVINVTSFYIGIPKSDARTDKVAKAADRFLRFYSTQEAQLALIGDLYMISNIKNVKNSVYNELSDLHECLNAGRVFTSYDFRDSSMPGSFVPRETIRSGLLSILEGNVTVDEAMKQLDEEMADALSGEFDNKPDTVATASEDFSILEVSEYIADMYRQAANADIGLIANNETYRGNVMRIFSGDISTSLVHVLLPRSFGNGSKLTKYSMTGRQLLNALNSPPGKDKPSNCIYAFSGLKCNVSPWKPLGQKYLSVALEDGTVVDPEKNYTVAAWEGTLSQDFTPVILETYDDGFETLLTRKLKADKVIAPSKDKRLTLIWE